MGIRRAGLSGFQFVNFGITRTGIRLLGKHRLKLSMGMFLATLAYHLMMQLRMVIYNSGYLTVLLFRIL